ncbi:MAG: tetratricopeptide repeat protein [Salibacteraceae bacterium]
MAKKKEDEIIVDVEQVYSRTEQWVIENQKSLSIIVGAVLLLVLSYFAYDAYIYEPQEKEAQSYMWQPQQAFEADSLELALNGNEESYGFLDIIDQYGITSQANLAHYYAGICYLRLGEYELAIEYLEDFDCDDALVCAVALGATGDAYIELGNVDKAITYFLSAADHSENDLISPVYLMKAARAYEEIGEYADALEIYERIKYDHPGSIEAASIEKFIARAETRLNR